MDDRQLTKGEKTKARLVDAAFVLFAEQGFHATTMRQIADGAGLTPGSIYNHFSSKDQLFLSVIQAYHPLTVIAPLLGDPSGKTISAFVKGVASQFAQSLEEHPLLINLALVEIVELKGKHLPALVQTFWPQMERFANRLEKFHEDLRPVQVHKATRVFLGMLFAYFLSEMLMGFSTGLSEVNGTELDDFIDIYLRGILINDPGE